ncbi:hypothetical protein J7413_16080 [Shimia sp. R10_1]|uniref:MaoC/PaaZ C-terminal domain-containing protein n=1 Tax=Shimia sp. R10_1 TaxID=2821095 RepID=UPI001ADAA22D|nr:MaoC/PaaZ C-terminal domain-containing protein [Shimia sp. R10_1]MBO9475066.1 hypothetical protein [Shimia sp. R10_1]
MSKAGTVTKLVLQQGVAPAQEAALATLLAELTVAPAPQLAPITSKVLLLGDAALADVRRALRAPLGTHAVQESQSFLNCQDAAIHAGHEVVLHEARTEAAASFRFGLSDAGAQMETRVKFLSATQIREMSPPQFAERMAPPTAAITEVAPLTSDVVARYLALAHDDNPIHTDDVIAKVAGFDGAIVPGMLLCALSEALCRATGGSLQISDVRARFLSAVRVGASVRCIVSPFAGGATQKSRVFVVGVADQIHAIIDVFGAKT